MNARCAREVYDPRSPDAAMLDAFGKVLAGRAWIYSFDGLRETDPAAWSKAETEMEARDPQQHSLEQFVLNAIPQTPRGIAAQLMLTITGECPKWMDICLSTQGMEALCRHPDLVELDGRDQQIISVCRSLLLMDHAASYVSSLFRQWYTAELTAHYAAPCPDEIMGQITAATSAAEELMAATPAANAQELLLKVFPLFLANFEPRKPKHPLVPTIDSGNGLSALLHSVIADFARISPLIAEAMATPNPYIGREAA